MCGCVTILLCKLVLIVIVAEIVVREAHVSAAPRSREPRCPSPPVEGWVQPVGCSFGIVKDICDRPSCAMGPGEFCKYKQFSSSNCGEGTFCHCSRCMGCSLFSYECFETTCVFAMSSRRRR